MAMTTRIYRWAYWMAEVNVFGIIYPAAWIVKDFDNAVTAEKMMQAYLANGYMTKWLSA
jgi:hypothetical protein